MKYPRRAFAAFFWGSLTCVCVACSASSAAPAAPTDPAPPVDPGPVVGPDGPHADGGPDGPPIIPVAPGAVDPSFGVKGIASGTVAATPTIRFSRDGRTVVFEHKTNVYATLTALLANGTPDKSQGPGGLAEVLIPNAMNHSQSLNASARIDDDGSVFVSGGMKQDGVYYVPFVGRVRSSSLDLTFGNSGGLWTFPDVYAVVGNVLTERSSGAAIGYFAVVSFSSLGGAGGGTPRDASTRVYHLTAAGVTDAAYAGGKGYFELPSIDQVVLDASGLPIAFSHTAAGTIEVRRLTKAGALDTTYGAAGVANITWAGLTSFGASPIALAKGGLLVALTASSGTGGTSRIVRLGANGAAVDAFPGMATRDVPSATVRIADELADGRLLVTGYDATTQSIERWLADGKPDTAFGQAGKVSLSAIAGADSLAAVSATSGGATMVATTRSAGSAGGAEWTIRRLGP